MADYVLDEYAIRRQGKADGVTHFVTGVAVFRDGKLLVVCRAATDDVLGGEWELPGGGVGDGETVTQGAIRELREETGLEVDTVLGVFESFDYETPKKPKARQINFKVTCQPADVTLDPAEHDAYRWIECNDIPGLQTNPVMQACLHNAFQ